MINNNRGGRDPPVGRLSAGAQLSMGNDSRGNSVIRGMVAGKRYLLLSVRNGRAFVDSLINHREQV
jgi:hypothetical protein